MNPGVVDSGVKIVTNGLLLWVDAAQKRSYPTSGTTWTDLSGNGNNGTLTNGPTFNSANGGSIVFDGSNDYVNTAVQRNATMTLECFFKSNARSGFQEPLFISKGSGANKVFIGKPGDNSGFSIFFGPNAYTEYATDGTNIWNNAWHQMLFSANAGNGSLYIDGVFKYTLNFGATTRTDTIGIGGLNDDYAFRGNIAIARIYNRALSGTEALQNYNAEKSRFGL